MRALVTSIGWHKKKKEESKLVHIQRPYTTKKKKTCMTAVNEQNSAHSNIAQWQKNTGSTCPLSMQIFRFNFQQALTAPHIHFLLCFLDFEDGALAVAAGFSVAFVIWRVPSAIVGSAGGVMAESSFFWMLANAS